MTSLILIVFCVLASGRLAFNLADRIVFTPTDLNRIRRDLRIASTLWVK